MKKICLLLIPVLIFLTSCSVQRLQYLLVPVESRAEKLTEKIVQSISDEDSASFQALFSKKVRAENHDFNENVTKLFEFIQGDIVSSSIVSGVGISKQVHFAKVTQSIDFNIDIETSDQKYHIWLEPCIRDDSNEDNIGITYFYIVNDEDWLKSSLYGPGRKISQRPTGIIIQGIEANDNSNLF